MKVSKIITTIVGLTAVFCMLGVPVMADTTMNGSLFAGNGYGQGDGTGRDASDGEGNGPSTGECTSGVLFSIESTTLLARGGNGNGGGNGGNDGGKGDCDGSGSVDRDGDRDQDRDRPCQSC
jgi:hypothetical protein